jgi:hypothetical protein
MAFWMGTFVLGGVLPVVLVWAVVLQEPGPLTATNLVGAGQLWSVAFVLAGALVTHAFVHDGDASARTFLGGVAFIVAVLSAVPIVVLTHANLQALRSNVAASVPALHGGETVLAWMGGVVVFICIGLGRVTLRWLPPESR